MSQCCFGKNLKKIRKEHGLSQKELAKAIKISPQNICRWERGEAYPQIIWVYEIAEVLGIEPRELL